MNLPQKQADSLLRDDENHKKVPDTLSPFSRLYAGKPMSYWLATLNSRDYDRDVYDLGEQWMFRHFGDAAVPGLVEALREDYGLSAAIELDGIGSPATVRALTPALKHEDRRVRIGAATTMYGISTPSLGAAPLQ